MSKKVILLLAEGFAEVEALTPVDYLRRAGITVVIAAVGKSLTVMGARSIPVIADTALDAAVKEGAPQWDAVVVPGGLPGADNIASSGAAGAFLKEMAKAGKLTAAICAAPSRVLAPLGILAGRKFTCFPGEEKRVPASAGAEWKEERVVIDGNLITARAAGVAGEFSRAIIAALLGEAAAKKVAESVLL